MNALQSAITGLGIAVLFMLISVALGLTPVQAVCGGIILGGCMGLLLYEER